MTDKLPTDILDQLHQLVDDCRDHCLWWYREDFYPETPAQAKRVLDNIAQHGTVEDFKRASRLRQWLLRNYNVVSAG